MLSYQTLFRLLIHILLYYSDTHFFFAITIVLGYILLNKLTCSSFDFLYCVLLVNIAFSIVTCISNKNRLYPPIFFFHFQQRPSIWRDCFLFRDFCALHQFDKLLRQVSWKSITRTRNIGGTWKYNGKQFKQVIANKEISIDSSLVPRKARLNLKHLYGWITFDR